MSVFEIKKDSFYLDGKPLQILSGAMHYFRILPEYWEDRLTKLKACGFNTVETYIPWNLHEKREGQFDFSGILDIERYIRMAQELGLYVLLRPSPYICAEWEFGGLPAWLLQYEMELRCCDPLYLEKVRNYYAELIPRLAKWQCTKGGPVLMLQIENEYGSFGNDSGYLAYLADLMREYGIEVPFFTSDGDNDLMMTGGTLPDVFKTVNFGSRPAERFASLRRHQPDYPLMCAEFWDGWFDHWGEEHHRRDAAEFAESCETMLNMHANVNFYMFHGGTNFGFMNGAGCKEYGYRPVVTSYDYSCLLSEEGNPTANYETVKKIFKAHGITNGDIPINPPVRPIAYGDIHFTEYAPLLEQLEQISEHHSTCMIRPMEAFGQNYGFILYRTKVSKVGTVNIELREVHDRAHVFIDGKRVDILYRNGNLEPIEYTFDQPGATLDIFVENMGRVNYGKHLKDHKGLTRDVLFDLQRQFGWNVYTMEMEDLSGLTFKPCDINAVDAPMFLRGTWHVDEISDTYLRMDHFTKGQVWINGFNLGRYWTPMGPQKTLYIPAALLKHGENELMIFETDGSDALTATFTDEHDIG